MFDLQSCHSWLFHLYLHSLICAYLSALPAYSRPHLPYLPLQVRPSHWKLHTLFCHHRTPWSRKSLVRTPLLCPDGPIQAHKKHTQKKKNTACTLFSSFLVSDSKIKQNSRIEILGQSQASKLQVFIINKRNLKREMRSSLLLCSCGGRQVAQHP